MSEKTADIVGKKGSTFTITLDAAIIVSAYLEVPNQPILNLAIGDDEREVTVTNLPVGVSWVRLDLIWSPGDSNATIDVGTGAAKPANPKHTLDDGNTPGYVELFGK